VANDSVVETRRALAAALRASGRAAEAGREEAAAAALEGGSARPGARTLDVFLNYACQAKCAFCYNPPLTAELTRWTLPMARLAAELTKGRRAGYDGVTYSGGEVTLLPDLPQRVALARKAGYPSVGVITNGIRLADPEYAGLLADCGLTFAVVSIHGADAVVHDRRVAVPGAFAKALRALENLRARGVLLVLNFVLTREDGPQAAAFVERFAGEPGVAELQLYYPHYDGLAAVNAGELRLPFAAAAGPLRAALAAARRLGAQERVFLYNVPPCALPEAAEHLRNWAEEPEALLVDPKGLEDGRFGSERRGRVKTAECARCVHGPRCLGFEEGYVAAFGSGEMRAV
jgi:sulfatase maturation enzyme AslB (radical SAM superfamily)